MNQREGNTAAMTAPPPMVLIVDDEDAIREGFRVFLEDYGYGVLEASDGREGLELFHRHGPDLILVDLLMPGIDGLTMLAKIKERSPETPMIIVSGTGMMGDAIEALRLGAWDYMLKPIEDMTMLRHSIERALERSRLIAENREYREHLEEKVKQRTAALESVNRDLIETRKQIIHRLGKAAEYKDNETGRHVIRVSYYSGILAETLGLPAEFSGMVRLASPMHDVGKIGIPDKILLKSGPLDSDEWALMQKHCEIGHDMLEPLSAEEALLYRRHTSIGREILEGGDSELLRVARVIAASHHEHWDGSGYPAGMRGAGIPMEARIVTVADIYDALSSKRPYKDAFPEEKCQRIIRELSETFLDPRIVEAFFDSIERILAIKEEWKD